MILPALWPVVEAWILDGLAENRDEMGSDRPLDQSRRNFRAEANERRALLNIYLARLRLARGRVTGALDAAARAVEQTWNPDVFSQAAEIHRGAGSNLRAAELLALSRVDPITLLKPSLRADGLGGGGGPSEAQLSAARRIMYDRLTSALLDEPVGLDARLRSPTGRDTTLGAIVRGKPVLLVHASRPDLVPDDAFALLDANGERLRAAGVHTLMMAQRPTPAAMEQSDFDSRFYHDSRYEAWDDLRAWREVQYFVLDPRGSTPLPRGGSGGGAPHFVRYRDARSHVLRRRTQPKGSGHMTRRRMLPAALIAIAAAAAPIRMEADVPLGVELKTAACAGAGCGSVSLADCFCLDIQMPNHRPQCDE